MKLMVVLLCAALCVSLPASAAAKSTPACSWTINKAGRFRMLSQRMAKFYIEMGHGVDTDRARAGLASSIAVFDQQLAEVHQCPGTDRLQKVYDELETQWIPYKRTLLSIPATREDEQQVAADSDRLMDIADRGVRLMDTVNAETTVSTVNLSGRERMLSQRMAKLVEARLWGVTAGDNAQELTRLRSEFVHALDQLERENAHSQRIANQLALARQQWFFFDDAIKGNATDRMVQATNVATTSERILEVMDNLTTLYDHGN